MRLRAPLPGWRAQADVVVIGSGVAGLTTALQIRAHNLSVLLVTKSSIDAEAALRKEALRVSDQIRSKTQS